jgi:outer membrane immunogenic protein
MSDSFGGKNMLKKLLISTAAVAAMAGSALAADLPRRAPPPPPPPLPPVFTWTGFYVGVNGGYIGREATRIVGTSAGGAGVGSDVQTALAMGAGATTDLRRTDGFLGGGQVGFNWQPTPFVVLGVEGDAQGTSLRRNDAIGTVAPVTCALLGCAGATVTSNFTVQQRLDWIATLRARLGVTPLPNLMIYATGGAAFGNPQTTFGLSQTINFPPIAATATGFTAFSSCGNNNGLFGGNNNNNCFRVGYTLGGGVEWMFLPNWSVKAEALYYDLGTTHARTVNTIGPAFGTGFTARSLVQVDNRVRGVIARAGLNYHFSWGAPAPVVARY